MQASQFTESQKAQMVEQYRAGDSSVVVAKRFGCSDRTVMRFVRDRLDPAEFEALKQQNRKRSAQAPTTTATTATTATTEPAAAATQNKPSGGTGQLTESQKAQIVEQYRAGNSSVMVAKRFGCSDRTVMRLVRARLSAAELAELKEQNRKRSSQAHTKPGDGKPAASSKHQPPAAAEKTVDNDNATEADEPTEMAQAVDLDVNQLPSPLYLLVERSVELQPQALGSLQQLGPLHTEEQQRQGLVLFSNVRQARRQCRRNQRIVKVADPTLLDKTAPHLLARGISRLVIEDTLYALPGSAAQAQP